MFEAEAAGLDAMFSTDTIRVPKPWKVSECVFCHVFLFVCHCDLLQCIAAYDGSWINFVCPLHA
jgi:fructosamine-3-kinase